MRDLDKGFVSLVVHEQNLTSPVMIIIGEVVLLSDQLDWFHQTLEKTGYDTGIAAHI